MAKRQVTIPKEYDQTTFSNIIRDVESRLNKLEAPVKTYAITNPPGSPVRSLNVAAATLADVRDFLGSLIADLQAAGKLGK